MTDSKIIINVGRQLGSGGHIIGQELAKEFGCTFYDKEILNLAAKESGFSEKFFEQHDEHWRSFKSLFHLHAQPSGDNSFYPNRFSQESLFLFQADAIRKAADASSCVFVGRCADYILRDYPNVVNLFITADMEERLARVMERHQCDEEAARKIISSKENSRASYYNYFTGKKWGHAESYDLCVNTSMLGLDATVALISHFIRERTRINKKEGGQ